jgi:cell division protein FtsW
MCEGGDGMNSVAGLINLRARSPLRIAGHATAKWDPWIVGSISALLLLGLVMVYSASVSIAERATGNSLHYLVRHIVSVVLGVTGMLIVMRTRARLWETLGPYLLLIGIALLVIVLLPGIGVRVNGSSRWLSLGVVNLQPSELMKLFMVVYAAGYLARKQEELRFFTQGILMLSIVLAVIGMLLLQEPDLGSVVVISLTVFVMLFLGGVRFWHFTAVVSAGLGGMALLTYISPYRMARFTGFLDPWADPFNTGFQLTQALIAFGRGEWLGVGLGASIQKMFYLPAAHTDFLFAVLAEELGLLGVLAVMALFSIIVWRAFSIARRAEINGQVYAARLAQGIGLLLGMQAMINMGVNMGALPTKGLTLPFVSYGGSSMIVSCLALGLLLMVEREQRRHKVGAA